MKTKHLSYFVLLLLTAGIFASCKKDLPDQDPGTPVFKVSGTINNAAVALTAGDNSYYMYSSYSDSSNVYTFSGELKTQGSTSPSPNSMAIHIRDSRSHAITPTLIDSALLIGSYNFQMPSILNTVDFTANTTGDSALLFSWNFGDSNTSTQANPTHTYTTSGIYNVCLTASGALNSNTLCDSVYVGVTPPMNVDFTATALTTDSVAFLSNVTGGSTPYSYLWEFGDGGMGGGSQNSHVYTFPDSVYTVQLHITDATFQYRSKHKNIGLPLYTGIVTNFSWQSTAQSLDFSKVVVEWTDASGTLFTSENAAQSGTFQVLSVENYSNNENGDHTKKVHILINCTLYNGANTITLQNVDVVFAFAYP